MGMILYLHFNWAKDSLDLWVLVKPPLLIPPDIVNAREALQAKRKLKKILRSRALHEINVIPGDLVQETRKRENGKVVICKAYSFLKSYVKIHFSLVLMVGLLRLMFAQRSRTKYFRLLCKSQLTFWPITWARQWTEIPPLSETNEDKTLQNYKSDEHKFQMNYYDSD